MLGDKYTATAVGMEVRLTEIKPGVVQLDGSGSTFDLEGMPLSNLAILKMGRLTDLHRLPRFSGTYEAEFSPGPPLEPGPDRE